MRIPDLLLSLFLVSLKTLDGLEEDIRFDLVPFSVYGAWESLTTIASTIIVRRIVAVAVHVRIVGAVVVVVRAATAVVVVVAVIGRGIGR
jgi:hypothetical protein